MKILYLGMMLVLILLSRSFLFESQAHAMWVPLSSQELLEQSKTIFVGNVTSVIPVDVQYQSQFARNGTIKQSVGPETMTLDEYAVHVEKFLQSPQDYDTIKLRQATVGGVPSGPSTIGGFEVGDKVLFYLPKYENQTYFPMQYLPESFKISQNCDGKDVLTQKRLDGGSNFTVIQNGIKVDYGNFTANKPIKFLYDKDMNTLSGKSFDVQVGITKAASTEPVFIQNIHTNSKPCEWIASADWEFTPQEGDYRMDVAIKEGGIITDTSDTGFSVKSDTTHANQMSPLEQFKSGVATNDVKCREGLQLVIKTSDGYPVCLKPNNAYILITHGWAKEFIQSTSIASQSGTCDGMQVPQGDHRTNIFPVLIMPQNSTATVCVIYKFNSDWNSYPNKNIYPHGILETCCFIHMEKSVAPVSSNQFKVLANPLLFNVTGVHNGSKVAVMYKISAGFKSKGFYDTSVPFDNCDSYPLAVGYDTSEVDASKFHANFDIPCYNTIDNVDSVKIVTGMTYKEVQFP